MGSAVGKISLPSTTLRFFDLGGQRDIRSIWHKYYDECHAVVFVLDAVDQSRLSETWEVFGELVSRAVPSSSAARTSMLMMAIADEVLMSPRLLNLPLLLLANKQDVAGSLSVEEIRESFEAWTRAHASRSAEEGRGLGTAGSSGQQPSTASKGKGKEKAVPQDQSAGSSTPDGDADGSSARLLNDDGAREARVASLDVMGVSALEGYVLLLVPHRSVRAVR